MKREMNGFLWESLFKIMLSISWGSKQDSHDFNLNMVMLLLLQWSFSRSWDLATYKESYWLSWVIYYIVPLILRLELQYHFRSSYNNLASLDEKERLRQDRNDIRYLHLLRALIHNQIKFVDFSLKEEGQNPARYRMLVDTVLIH